MNTEWKIIGVKNNVLFLDFNALACYLFGHKQDSWNLPDNRTLHQCRRCGKTWTEK